MKTYYKYTYISLHRVVHAMSQYNVAAFM